MNTSEKNPFTATPIYYIVVEQNYPQAGFYLSIGKILRVFDTTTAQVDRLHREHIMPLINEGRNVQGVCYYREPGNPFREASHNGQ